MIICCKDTNNPAPLIFSSTPAGIEPAREYHSGLVIHPLNHSGKVSIFCSYQFFVYAYKGDCCNDTNVAIFILYCVYINNVIVRRTRHLSGLGLDEVVLQVALEIEIGKGLVRLHTKKLLERSIGDNGATIRLVLEIVRLNILINFLGNRSARHFSTLLLAEENSKLITDAGGLHETRRLAVARVSLAAKGTLLGGLEVAHNRLLKELVLGLKSGNKRGKLRELAAKIRELGRGRANIRGGRGTILNHGGLRNNRVFHGSGSGGLGRLLLLRGGGGFGSFHGLFSRRSGSSFLCHFYILLKCFLFKSFNAASRRARRRHTILNVGGGGAFLIFYLRPHPPN